MQLTLLLTFTGAFGLALAKPNIKARLIGGTEATPHAYPYMAYIHTITSHGDANFCGGSLLSKNYVLTSARCVTDIMMIVAVKLGAINPFEDEDTQIEVNTAGFTYHSKYNSQTNENDIAVIKLETDIQENDNIKFISLPTQSQTFEGKTGILSGWGLMDGNNGSSIARTLRYISAPILSNTECEKYLNGQIKSGHICLSGRGYETGCNGDFGGPVTVDGVLAGVFSFVSETCPVGLPSVATRVTSYLDWIKAQMK